MESCLKNDDGAWGEFRKRIEIQIRAKFTLSDDDVEDAVQHVCLKLLENNSALLRSFNPARASIETFLDKVTGSRVKLFLARGSLKKARDFAKERDIAWAHCRRGAADYDRHPYWYGLWAESWQGFVQPEQLLRHNPTNPGMRFCNDPNGRRYNLHKTILCKDGTTKRVPVAALAK